MLPKAIPNPAVPLCLRKSLRFNRFFIAAPPPFISKNQIFDLFIIDKDNSRLKDKFTCCSLLAD